MEIGGDNMTSDYDWEGNWQGPGHGTYIIFNDGREMEPGEVIDRLNELQDLIEQINRIKDLRNQHDRD
jgi:hypothetical protein